jgi:radical SAM superfamily enzyme YgiQ (UPF0313 family)
MKVLLLMPRSERVPIIRTSYNPPLGLLSIGASLRKYSPDASVGLLNGEIIDESELLTGILDFEPDILGISTNVGCYRSALDIAKKTKSQNDGIQIVLGGPYVSAMWRECLSNRPYIDACVVDDGEFPMIELSKGVSPRRVAGVATRDDGGKPTLPVAPIYYDLDRYPNPDWSLIDIGEYQAAYRQVYGLPHANLACINSHKGCRWREKTGGCIFCGLVRPFPRSRSPVNVWGEIKNLNTLYLCNHFWELSDSICMSVEWMKEFRSLKPSELHLSFRGYARSSEITQESVELLRDIGYEEVFIGIESGDDTVLRASTKGTTAKINYRATKLLANNGIKTFASVVLGLPGETKQSLRRTYDHVLELFDTGLYTLSVCVFAPYVGSTAFKLIIDNPSLGSNFRNQDVFDWPSFSRIWIENYCDCNFSDIMDFIPLFTSLKGCLYEDNFTYVNKIYHI